MNEADSLLPSLEQGLDGAWDTEEIALGEGTPYARVRVLMARAMERLAGQALLSRLPQVSSQDVRRDLDARKLGGFAGFADLIKLCRECRPDGDLVSCIAAHDRQCQSECAGA